MGNDEENINWEAVEKTLKGYAEDMKKLDAVMTKFKESTDDYDKEVHMNMVFQAEGLLFVNAIRKLSDDMGVSMEELLKLAKYLPTPPDLEEGAEEEPVTGPAEIVTKEKKAKTLDDLDKQAKQSYS